MNPKKKKVGSLVAARLGWAHSIGWAKRLLDNECFRLLCKKVLYKEKGKPR